MSVRQDKVQIVLEFLNEESKSLSRHIVDAKKLNDEVKALAREEAKLAKEFEQTAQAGKSTLEIEQKRVKVQEQIQEKLQQILKTGHGIEDLDLSKVVPSQLVNTAKELAKAMEFIPQSHPSYLKLQEALKKVNDQLATNRAASKGVALGLHEAATEGGRLQRILDFALGDGLNDLIQHAIGSLREWGRVIYDRAREIEFIGRKSKLVFGDASNDIEAFAQKMSTRVGQSSREVLKDLTSISNFFVTLELDKKYIPGLTKQIYDISAAWSAYNAGQYSVMGVQEKMQKALGGELDELAELGIAVTEDTLKKELQKRGYDKLTGAAYDQAAALTLIEIVQRKTIEAQKEFGNSQDTIYTKTNAITAGLKSLRDYLAEKLTPAFGVALSLIAPIFRTINESFRDLTPNMTKLQEATEKERFALGRAVEETTKYKIGSSERKEAIAAIIKIHPQFLEGLNAETVSNEQLRAKMQAVNQQYIAKIVAIQAGKEVELQLNKERDATDRLANAQVQRANAVLNARKFMNDYTSTESDLLQKMASESNKNHPFTKGYWSDRGGELRKYTADLAVGLSQISQIDTTLSTINSNKNAAQNREKEVIDQLKKQMPELAAQFDMIAKAAEQTGTTIENNAGKIKFTPERTKQEIDAAMKLELDAAKATMERRLIILEKEKLEGTKTVEEYHEDLYAIKLAGLQSEQTIYEKYKKSESLDAARVAKEIVEAEKNKSEAILRIRLEEAERVATIQRTLAEQKFLQNTEGATSPEKFDKEERAYKLQLIEIDRETAIQRMLILREFHQSESVEYLKQQNIILKLAKDKANLIQKGEEESQKETLKKLHDEIENRVILMHEGAAREDAALRVKFAGLVGTEQELELQRLELKREMIRREIAIKQQGDEAQRAQAQKLGDDLIKIDGDIEAKKLENKRRTTELQGQLEQNKSKMTSDALDLAIGFLSKDEDARRKHASAIKAFEVGKIWVNAYSEIAAIWRNANANPLNILVPGWGTIQAGIMTGLAIGRATLATRNVTNQKFAKGGFTGLVPGEPDETGEVPAGIVHAGEWVGNRRMVAQNPQLFQDLNRLQFSNANIAGLNLSPKQNLYLPQYSVVNNSTTYTPQGSYSSTGDDRLLAAFLGFKGEITEWQKSLGVDFSYQNYVKFKNRLETDFNNASI
jgi:hypothetical protein